MNNLAAVVLGALLAAAALSATLRHIAGEDRGPVLVDGELCVYTVYVGTGTEWKGWADGGAVGVKLCGLGGDCFSVPDVTAWGGVMWPGHEYFQWGAIDAFSGRARCLAAPPCSVEITVSGGGGGWYCEFVQVTATGPRLPCHQRTFKVQQWLSSTSPLTSYRL